MLLQAVLHRDGVTLEPVLGLDAHEEGGASPRGHALARVHGGLEDAGEGALQLGDGLLHQLAECVVGILTPDVLDKLGDTLGVGLGLELVSLGL